MSAAFEQAWKRTLPWEGGFSDDPADSGGETRFGITKETARRYGYTGAMTALPLKLAGEIAHDGYWEAFGLEAIGAANRDVAAYLFDICFNHSPKSMALIAQRAASRFVTVSIDGAWGKKTEAALLAAAQTEPDHLLDRLRLERIARRLEVIAAKPSQKKFLLGWLRRDVAP